MRGIIDDFNLLRERAVMLNEGRSIETQQLSLETYLERLSNLERETLLKIADCEIGLAYRYFRKDLFSPSLFAVGTTTYGDGYWYDLEAFLGDDPSKKSILENRGEDIDILFCPSYDSSSLLNFSMESEYKLRFNKNTRPSQKRLFFDRKKILKKIDSESYNSLSDDELFVWTKAYDFRTVLTAMAKENKWKISNWSDGAEFGVHYFGVPEKFQKKLGQKVIRVKGENFGVENVHLEVPGCRTFHIYVDDSLTAPHKLYYERLINIPFTLLFTSQTKQHFKDLINKKNGTYKPRLKYISQKDYISNDDLPF